MSANPATVRPELVEGLSFFVLQATSQKEEGQGFDKLSPNGEGCFDVR